MTTTRAIDRPKLSTEADWSLEHAHSGIAVIPLRNPVLETLGHHPTSRYAERYWLPTLGPTACWLHRNLVTRLEANPHGVHIDLPTVAREIGVGTGMGRNAPIIRTLKRLRDFELVELADGHLGVQMTLPPLSRRLAARLPEHLGAELRPEGTVATHAVPRTGIGIPSDELARNGIEAGR